MEFVNLMRSIGSDYPSSMRRVFNDEKNDWEVWSGHGEPPAEVTSHFNAIATKTVRKWQNAPNNEEC